MESSPKENINSTHDTPHTDTDNDPQKKESLVGEIIRFSIIALIIVLPIRLFIAQPFIVSGASMENTFYTGEYLIVDQVTYRYEEPERGDIIIFRYPRETSKFFIKRIIGLPGDTITINGHEVTITNAENPDGFTLDEFYSLHLKPIGSLTETLGEKEYFVMGDNRDQSSDSRSWGVLHRDLIVGRAFLRLFPISEVGVLPGDYNLEEHIQ